MEALQISNDSKCRGRNISNYSPQNFEAPGQLVISSFFSSQKIKGNLRVKGGSNLERLGSLKSFFQHKGSNCFIKEHGYFTAILFPPAPLLSKKNTAGSQLHVDI